MRKAMAQGQILEACHRKKVVQGIEPDSRLQTGFDSIAMRKAETVHYQIIQKKNLIYQEEYYGQWYQKQQISREEPVQILLCDSC